MHLVTRRRAAARHNTAQKSPVTRPGVVRSPMKLPMSLSRPVLLLCLLLAACAASAPSDPNGSADTADEAEAPRAPPVVLDGTAWNSRNQIEGLAPDGHWQHQVYAGRRPTRYRSTEHLGRPAVLAQADGANSTLRLHLSPPPGALPGHIRFSWAVPALLPQADLAVKGEDDAVVRLILSFEGDRSSHWTARDHLVSELSNLIAGAPLPFASLMYVWDSRYPVGSVIPNPYTNRIRQLVIASGPEQLNQWVDFDRDIEADYRLAFGEAPGPLVGLGLMSDTNNSGASVSGWYGPISLSLK